MRRKPYESLAALGLALILGGGPVGCQGPEQDPSQLTPELRHKIAALRERLYNVEQDGYVAYGAAVELIRLRRPQSLAVLHEALAGERRDLRLVVVKALGEEPLPEVVDRLMSFLPAPDAEVRQQTIESLGRFPPGAVLPALKAVALDPLKPLLARQAAVEVLQRHSARDSVPVLIEAMARDGEIRPLAQAALVRVTGQQLSEVSDWRKWYEEHKDQSPEQWLRELNQKLQQQLDREQQRALAWWAKFLTEIRGDPARLLGELKAALADDYAPRRALAVKELGRTGPPAVEPLLAHLAQEPDVRVRQEGLRSLGLLKDARATAVVLPCAQRGDIETRRLALWALGELKDPAAVEAVLALLDDPLEDIVADSFEVLGKLRSNPELKVSQRILQRALAYREMARAPEKLLLAAMKALGQLEYAQEQGRAEAVKLARDLLDARYAEGVRYSAAEALGQLKDPASEQALIRLLADERPALREAAAQALERLLPVLLEPARRGVALALVKQVADAEAIPRARAVAALKQLLPLQPGVGGEVCAALEAAKQLDVAIELLEGLPRPRQGKNLDPALFALKLRLAGYQAARESNEAQAKAFAELNQLNAESPDDKDVLLLLARQRTRVQDYFGADQDYEALLRLDPAGREGYWLSRLDLWRQWLRTPEGARELAKVYKAVNKAEVPPQLLRSFEDIGAQLPPQAG